MHAHISKSHTRRTHPRLCFGYSFVRMQYPLPYPLRCFSIPSVVYSLTVSPPFPIQRERNTHTHTHKSTPLYMELLACWGLRAPVQPWTRPRFYLIYTFSFAVYLLIVARDIIYIVSFVCVLLILSSTSLCAPFFLK